MSNYDNCKNTIAKPILGGIVCLTLSSLAQAQTFLPDRVAGQPDLNGIWQAVNTAHWNLESHGAEALPNIWKLGAFAAIPAGQSFVVEGNIPYLPEARQKKRQNLNDWPENDPVVNCYMPGIPRATYMPYPFQIIQGGSDILFAYSFATSNRVIHMGGQDDAPVDMWMGWSNGSWDGDTLEVKVTSNDDRTWLDRSGNHHSNKMVVTERYTLISDNHIQYEATIEDPLIYSKPWTIRMTLYRMIDPNVQLLDYKCVEFSEELLYGEFEKEQ